MNPVRLCWIIFIVILAYLNYGDTAVKIALVGHVGLRLAGLLLAVVFGPLAYFLIGAASLYLMYLTVHLLGWGCFWLLFLSFCYVTVGGES